MQSRLDESEELKRHVTSEGKLGVQSTSDCVLILVLFCYHVVYQVTRAQEPSSGSLIRHFQRIC